MVKGIDVLLLRSAPSELHSMVLCFLLLFKWRDWVLHSWIEVDGGWCSIGSATRTDG